MVIFSFYFTYTGAAYIHVICSVSISVFVKLLQRVYDVHYRTYKECYVEEIVHFSPDKI